MQPFPVSVLPPATRIRPRTALVASADRSFRQRLTEILTGLRWQVREAEGGAQAWAEAETTPPEAIIVDSWLPDLDLAEFLKDFRGSFPQVDLVTAGGVSRPRRARAAPTARSCSMPCGAARTPTRRRGMRRPRSISRGQASDSDACRIPGRACRQTMRRDAAAAAQSPGPDPKPVATLRAGSARPQTHAGWEPSRLERAAAGTDRQRARACSRSAAASAWWPRA